MNEIELEPFTELEEQQEWNAELQTKNRILTAKLLFINSTIKRYFELKSFPLDLTSDENQELIRLETILKNQ